MEYGFAKLSPKRIVAGTENCGSKRVIPFPVFDGTIHPCHT
jgi:hypothetical protein